MESSLKKAWKIISPVIIYLIIERIIGFCINFYYIMGRLDQDAVWTDEIEAQMYTEVYEMISQNTVLISGIVSSIGILIFFRMYKKEIKKRYYYIEMKESSIIRFFITAMVSVGFTLSVNLAINAWGIFKYDFDYTELYGIIYSEPLWIQILVIGIIIPICEELLFRGVIYERIFQNGSSRSAILLTSIIFAFFHGTWIQILYAFIFSFLIIYSYQRTGSFITAVFFHIISNLSSLALRQFPPLSTIGYSIGIVAFALIGISGLYLLKNKSYYKMIFYNDDNNI